MTQIVDDVAAQPNVQNLVDAIDYLADECHKMAREHGFHDREIQALSQARTPETSDWISLTAYQAEIARIGSELGEWVEAIRHDDPPDEHCPEFRSSEIEAADVLIRHLDTCKKRNIRIGLAAIAKMNYNAGRGHMHGKNS